MKVKKITVEYDNGTIIQFTEEELDALQKTRAVLEFIDTGANIANLLLKNPVFNQPSPFTLKKSPFTKE